MIDPIGSALAALARDEPRAALDHALAAWRARAHPDLARAIVTLGARVAREVEPLAGTSMKTRKRVWLAVVHRAESAAVDHVLATVFADTFSTAERAKRLDEVARLPADPRVARRFVELLADPRYDEAPLRSHLAALLARLGGDPFALAAPADPRAADIAALAAALVDPRAATDAATERDLLAAVYAAPGDDAPRMIYADWLQARGDPRGELIALQLAPDPPPDTKRRIAELERTYGQRWLGPLAIHLQWPAFLRGFLAQGSVKLGPGDRRPPDDPAWATMVGCTYRLPPLASARGLRETHYLEPDELAYFAAVADPPPIERLEIKDDDAARAQAIRALARCHLPALTRLAIFGGARAPGAGAPARFAWPWRELGVQALQLAASATDLPAWHAAIATEPRLARLELTGDAYDCAIAFARSPDTGAFDHLHVGYARAITADRDLARLAEGLAGLAPDALAHVALELPAAHRLRADDVRAVHAAVDRQTRLVTRRVTHSDR